MFEFVPQWFGLEVSIAALLLLLLCLLITAWMFKAVARRPRSAPICDNFELCKTSRRRIGGRADRPCDVRRKGPA